MATEKPSRSITRLFDAEILHDFELTSVPDEDRRSLLSIIAVWYGFLLTPSILFVGATIAMQSASFSVFVAAIAVGMLLAAVYATITGIVGERYGLSTYMIFRRFFGEWGSKLPTGIIILTRVGWTAVEAGVAATVVLLLLEFPGGQPLLAALLALLFLLTALLGYTGLDYLSKIAIPALAIVFFAAVIVVIQDVGLSQAIAHTPENVSPFTTLVGLALALWAAGATLTPDITRYAKSDRDVLVANFASIVPGEVFLLSLGAIVAFYTGAVDPAEGLAQIGLFGFGVLAVFLAAWTTCDNQYYSAGLAMSEITSRRKAPLLIIIGFVTAAVAYGNIYGLIIEYLTLIGIFVPPIVGVIAADYYLLGLRYPSVEEDIQAVQTKVNPAAIGAWLIGAVVGYFTPAVYIPALASFVGALAAYLILYYLDQYLSLGIHRSPTVE